MTILEHNKIYGELWAVSATDKGARIVLQLAMTDEDKIFCSTGNIFDQDQIIKMLRSTADSMEKRAKSSDHYLAHSLIILLIEILNIV